MACHGSKQIPGIELNTSGEWLPIAPISHISLHSYQPYAPSSHYPIAFGLPATVPIPVRSGPQGSVTILYCAWSFVTKKSSKTKRNAGLFSDFFFDALWHLGCRKSVEICSTSSQKSVKREAWGGSGGSGRSPWRHLGPKMAQSSKKG